MADALEARTDEIVAANRPTSTARSRPAPLPALVDRLDPRRARGSAAIADALREVAELPDPVGEVVRGYTLPNGLEVRQVRVPLGVVGIIYEARPNVTVDAAGLGLKSGNAVLLRGSSSAYALQHRAGRGHAGRARRGAGLPPTRSSWCRAPRTSRSST